MKLKCCLIVYLATFTLTTIAQPSPPPKPPGAASAPASGEGFADKLHKIMANAAGDAAPTPTLTKFNLDFHGYTPQELVNAIQKATGKPLNVIIPEENADVKLPPLKMNNVDVAQLFQALERASSRTEAYITGIYKDAPPAYQVANTSYGFETAGIATDDSIWYFRVSKPIGPPLIASKACRFYSLSPYLDRGITVDDITTAIQTGWKMAGEGASTPTISFHKETKLLIAVGEPGKLETIDAVLKALEAPKPKPVIDPTTGLPLPKVEPKAKQ